MIILIMLWGMSFGKVWLWRLPLLRRLLPAKGIGLPDQSREFGQRIVFSQSALITAATEVIGGVWSVLISIGHRDDASLRESRLPSAQQRPPPTRLSTKSVLKLSGFCRYPRQSVG
jgi:hypothetical protein